jgi:hypothetical protein
MVKSKMSAETRNAIKLSLGIVETNTKNNCRNCFYHPLENICNKHHIKTMNNDSCKDFKKDKDFKFVSGGGMSPR